jgi:hypothetical protein
MSLNFLLLWFDANLRHVQRRVTNRPSSSIDGHLIHLADIRSWKRFSEFLGWSERHTRRKLQGEAWLERESAHGGRSVRADQVSLQAFKENNVAAVSSAHSLGRGHRALTGEIKPIKTDPTSGSAR